MPAAKMVAAPPFFSWTFPGGPVRIDISLAVVERLKEEVLRSANKETGGILLGRLVSDSPVALTVTGFQPIPHHGGPLYALARSERLTFAQAANGLRVAAPATSVGYYRSHLREGLSLDKRDMALLRSCFPSPGDVALLMRPEPDGEITAGFFFWDEGEINSDFSFLEFPLDAGELSGQAAKPVPGAGSLTRWGRPGFVGLLAAGILGAGLLGLKPWERVPEARQPAPRSAMESQRENRAGIGEAGLEDPTGQTIRNLERRLGIPRSEPVASRQTVQEITGAAPNRPAETEGVRKPEKSFEPPRQQQSAAVPFEQPPIAATVPEPSAPSGPIRAEVFLESAPPPPSIAPSGAKPAAPEPAQSEPYVPPTAIVKVLPVVPRGFRDMLFRETRVQVKATLDETGKVVAAKPEKAPNAIGNLLGGVAADAALRWRFEPARRNSRPVPAEVLLNFIFARE